MAIHQHLKQLRQLSGMTQEEVASRVGLTRQAISSYESGRTQPDLEMLERLAGLYQTDLAGILDGRSQAQRQLRAVYRTAWIAGGTVLLLILIRSALILLTNTFFPVPSGAAITAATRQLIELRFSMIRVWGLLGGLSQNVAIFGCLILAVRLSQLKRLPSLKRGLLWAAAFAAGVTVLPVVFRAFDPIYRCGDYLLVAAGILPAVLLLMIYWSVLLLIKQRKQKTA